MWDRWQILWREKKTAILLLKYSTIITHNTKNMIRNKLKPNKTYKMFNWSLSGDPSTANSKTSLKSPSMGEQKWIYKIKIHWVLFTFSEVHVWFIYNSFTFYMYLQYLNSNNYMYCKSHNIMYKGLPGNCLWNFFFLLPEWPDNLQEWQFLEQAKRKTGDQIECQKEEAETLHLYRPCCTKQPAMNKTAVYLLTGNLDVHCNIICKIFLSMAKFTMENSWSQDQMMDCTDFKGWWQLRTGTVTNQWQDNPFLR